MTQPQNSAPLPMPAKRNGFPWLMVGCGCALALVVLVLVLGIAAYLMVSNVVEMYSDKAPKQLPVSAATPEEYQAIQTRIAAFRDAVKQGTPVEPLVLTGEEINAVIAYDPEWAPMKGRVHVSIDGDKITCETSFPLDKLGFSGRYFNGSVSVSSRMENGTMQMHVESAEVNGKPAPEQIMAAWRTQNLAENLNKNPELGPALEALESIEVKDGTIVFTPKIKP